MTLTKTIAILKLKDATETRVKEVLKLTFTKELVDLLFSYPYIKIKVLEENNIAKRQTASEYLKKMKKNGILNSVKIGNEVYYINTKLIEVLSK